MDEESVRLLIKALCGGLGALVAMNGGLLLFLNRKKNGNGGVTRREHSDLSERVTRVETQQEDLKEIVVETREDVKTLLRISGAHPARSE